MSATEMRGAIVCSASSAAWSRSVVCSTRQWPATRTIAALACAIGMQRLLVTYLAVTDSEPAPDGGEPSDDCPF